MGYLDGWIYQKSHTITGSAAGARTNYPTGIKVYYGSGTDGDEVVGGATFGKIYCDSKCRTDFGDIRFTKSDGASLLDYWIEEQVDGDYAIIWVEVDSIPASPGTVDIYIFYGNAGATTTSNGDDTWLIFNDCETTTGWSEQYVVGSPYWGPATLDGVQTIRIEANAHNEKLRIQYDTIICTGREGRRHLTRVKHTSWNADGYFYWYAPLALSPSTQYDALRYSSYFDYYTLYASVGGVSDTTNYSVAHPIGWYRYEKKTNAAGEVTAYRDATNLGTATVDGDYSGGKVMYYVNEWNSGLTRHYIDWFAVGKYVDPEPTHTAWGPEVSEVSRDLKAIFHVKQDSVDLKAEFTLRQLTNDLHASFWIRLPGIPADLFAKFETNLHHGIPADLYCKLHIRRIYDLSDSGGLGFFWEGVGRGHVDIEIFTPTGAWTGKFPDWGVMTWVPLKWEDLTEVDIDGSRPDKSQITGILWTYHSDGIRHVDWIVGLPKGGDRDIFGKFIVRQVGSADLKAEALIVRSASADLFAKFELQGTADLPAEFVVAQGFKDLKAEFYVMNEIYDYTASEILHNHDAETSEASGAFVKKKAITLNWLHGRERAKIVFDLKSDVVDVPVYAQLYVNDVVRGILQSISGTSYTTITEILSDMLDLDEIQLYLRGMPAANLIAGYGDIGEPEATTVYGGVIDGVIEIWEGISGWWLTGLAFDGTNVISCRRRDDYAVGRIYFHDGISNTIASYYEAFSSSPHGLTVADGDLVETNDAGNRIYVHDGLARVMKSQFDSPGIMPYGLTFDGTNLISSDQDTDLIYVHVGVTAAISRSFAAPSGIIAGLAFDGVNLISLDVWAGKIYVHDGVSASLLRSYDFGTAGVAQYGGLTAYGYAGGAATGYARNFRVVGALRSSPSTTFTNTL